ncbi:hypothetical protein ACQ86N_02710 [Puia sp. P3]|uniref:hypothetical protein n=1 Tax=Puia sp. P3 TaxID=3423952 RepID=UPI003D66C589
MNVQVKKLTCYRQLGSQQIANRLAFCIILLFGDFVDGPRRVAGAKKWADLLIVPVQQANNTDLGSVTFIDDFFDAAVLLDPENSFHGWDVPIGNGVHMI